MTAAARRAERSSAGGQDGLPLELDGGAPRTRFLDPEVATPCAAPFDGDDWIFGVDWDGSRCLLVTEPDGVVRLQGLTGSLTERFPEVAAAARGLRPGTVIDGSVCILDSGGRPDLGALSLRMAGEHRHAATFLATDLLAAAGLSLLGRGLAERLQRLAAVVPADSRIQLPDTVAGHGVALADAARQQGLSAILARRRDRPYHPGVASPTRLRIDLAGQRDTVVVGGRGTSRALHLVLAEWVDGRLLLAGTAPADGAAMRWYERTAEDCTTPPVEDAGGAGGGVVWVRPRLTATVAEAGPGHPLRLVALRDDIDPRWCVRRAAVEPPSEASSAPLTPFSPTVLRGLPLDAA